MTSILTFDAKTAGGRGDVGEILRQTGVITVMLSSDGIEAQLHQTIQGQLRNVNGDSIDRLEER